MGEVSAAEQLSDPPPQPFEALLHAYIIEHELPSTPHYVSHLQHEVQLPPSGFVYTHWLSYQSGQKLVRKPVRQVDTRPRGTANLYTAKEWLRCATPDWTRDGREVLYLGEDYSAGGRYTQLHAVRCHESAPLK